MVRYRFLSGLVSSRLYHSNVIKHYNNPCNVGTLDSSLPNVGTGLVGSPACGDVMRLQIMVDPEGKIIDAKFKTFGCGSAIAASSVTTNLLIGHNIRNPLPFTNATIANELKLPPVKRHCSMLAEDAAAAALHNLNAKQTEENLNNLRIKLS